MKIIKLKKISTNYYCLKNSIKIKINYIPYVLKIFIKKKNILSIKTTDNIRFICRALF